MAESNQIQSSIMFTDMVGYSRMMSNDQNHALKLLDEHNNIVIPLINQNNGKVIKLIGDAVFAQFVDARDAAECSIEIQNQLLKRNKLNHGKDQFTIRIGLHKGDVVVKDDDLFGNDVNLGSRIEGIAPHGGIAISKIFHDEIKDLSNMWTRRMGHVKLKNIVSPHEIYKLYVSKHDYQKESEQELQNHQESLGVRFVDLDSYDETEVKSVAIMYFDNLGSTDDEILCHSISAHMIDDLKKVSSIRSPSFNTVLKYKTSDLPLSEIARKLNVENIVSGSMLKSKDKLKVKLEMLNTATGEISWSDSWEGSTKFTGTMNGQMVSNVLEHLDVVVPEHITRYFTYEMTENAEANELYVKGRHALEHGKDQGRLEEAKKYFRGAIDLDDQFVEAYANLGMVYQWMNQFEKAEEELESALTLAQSSYNDPGLAYIYNLMGIFYNRTHKYPKAIRNFEKGLELQVQLQDRFGEGKILQNMGGCYSSMLNTEKAKENVDKAIEIYSLFEEEFAMGNALAVMGNIYKNMGQYTEALEKHNQAIGMYRKIDSIVNARRLLFVIYDTYVKLGMYEKTSHFFEDAKSFETNFDDYYFLGRSYSISSEINFWKGDLRQAEDDIHEAIYNFESAEHDYQLILMHNHLARFYLEVGKNEKARKTLRKSERLAKKNGDDLLIVRVKMMKDLIESIDNEIELSVLNEYDEYLSNNDCILEDWWVLSQAYKYAGDADKAKMLLKKAQGMILDASEKISDDVHRKFFLEEQMFNKKILNG